MHFQAEKRRKGTRKPIKEDARSTRRVSLRPLKHHPPLAINVCRSSTHWTVSWAWAGPRPDRAVTVWATKTTTTTTVPRRARRTTSWSCWWPRKIGRPSARSGRPVVVAVVAAGAARPQVWPTGLRTGWRSVAATGPTRTDRSPTGPRCRRWWCWWTRSPTPWRRWTRWRH